MATEQVAVHSRQEIYSGLKLVVAESPRVNSSSGILGRRPTVHLRDTGEIASFRFSSNVWPPRTREVARYQSAKRQSTSTVVAHGQSVHMLPIAVYHPVSYLRGKTRIFAPEMLQLCFAVARSCPWGVEMMAANSGAS